MMKDFYLKLDFPSLGISQSSPHCLKLRLKVLKLSLEVMVSFLKVQEPSSQDLLLPPADSPH